MNSLQHLLDNLSTYKINEVQEYFKTINIEINQLSNDSNNDTHILMEQLISKCIKDNRKGIKDLAKKYLLQKEKLNAEKIRTEQLYKWETGLWEKGTATIVGIDEVGRGCLAGPVVAAAVILPYEPRILYLNDSKKLSPEQRETCAKEIREKAIDFGIGEVSAERIDEVGIVKATFEAMRQAISQLAFTPDHILVDAFRIPGVSVTQTNLIGGDSLSASIAAASIIAKVYRDDIMIDYMNQYPEYGFENHKGYGTAEHLHSIEKYGINSLHRTSFLTKLNTRISHI